MKTIAHIRETDEKIIQSLEDHLIKVSEYSSSNASKIGMAEGGELLGLLHDVGKYSQSFQSYISSATGLIDQDADEYIEAKNYKGLIDHSTAGAQFIWNEAKEKNKQNQIVAQALAVCIASHHSGLIDCLTTEGEDNFQRRMSQDEEKTHYSEVNSKIDKEIINKINKIFLDDKTFLSVLNFMKNIAFKEESEKSIRAQFQYGLFLRMLYSCLIDADRLDTADFENPHQVKIRQSGKYVSWQILINRLEKYLLNLENKTDRNKIDEIRKIISDCCKNRASDPQGVFTLTVPTGGGKTLASLRFALYHAFKYNLDRIFYVIPFTSIIDQNAQVVREILETEKNEKDKIVLEHHSNLMPEIQNWKSKILTENWDAPVIFITTVQFLETFFGSGTRSARRMHQLVNSVIIFDEIQTLPVKTVHLFCNAINFLTNHCRASVVLCTATQPLLNKVDENKGCIRFDKSNEIINEVEPLFKELKRVEIENKTKCKGWTDFEIAELANNQVDECGNSLIVVNTKRKAQSIYEECSRINKYPVYHLSTSMCPAHRMKKLNEIRAKLQKSEHIICVSTQLIEAGVDIDFGSVIRFIAGLDSIIQAAGRCNRHGKRKTGKVFIVNSVDETIDSLTDIKTGKEQTERILRELYSKSVNFPKELIHPQTIDRYFQYYFYNRSTDMSFPVDVGRDDNLLNLLSSNNYSVCEYERNHHGREPSIYFRQSFKTAADVFKTIEGPTCGIIVPYGEEGKNIIAGLFSQFAVEKQFKLLKKAQRYTVNVFPAIMKQLMDVKAVKEVPEIGVLTLSDERYYHPEFGLNINITHDYNLLMI